MENFEDLLNEFISNAEYVNYLSASTYADIRRSNEFYQKEEALSNKIAECFYDRCEEIAVYLKSPNARVRRSTAYLLLGKMEPSRDIAEEAISVLAEYACSSGGDETLNARGFLLAYDKKHGTDSHAYDDVSLLSSLKKKYD